ncbi:MAG: hypothetical protein IPJ88_15220 [Myxococcales bacterium]|nr:MAG: hypothetical protein IPJ88_15220 [Myxococcales bacterium]
MRFAKTASAELDWLNASIGFADSYENLFSLVIRQSFQSPLLSDLQKSLSDGRSPLKALRRLVSFAELRFQGLLHVFLDPILLWDYQTWGHLNRWKKQHAEQAGKWFQSIADIEALSSLATLGALDQHSCFPTISGSDSSWAAQGLNHPLLPAGVCIENDLVIDGASSLIIVTGSNMAGKSTLLRAIGLNTALALAGGPVCAQQMQLPICLLRCSMRIQDSLQAGASYFHAELERLALVLANTQEQLPVLFLLDELLKGTNAAARTEGSIRILNRLLERGAMGLIATHDTELVSLENQSQFRIKNVHFTDVMVGEEMRFDYKLRQGPVKSSNALRLVDELLAGSFVPEKASKKS